MFVKIYKEEGKNNNNALVYYIGKYGVLYETIYDSNINDLFGLIQRGLNNRELLTLTRSDFDKRFTPMYEINIEKIDE